MFAIDPSFGSLHGGALNGYDVVKMQEEEDFQKVLRECEHAARCGANADEALQIALQKHNLKENDLSSFEKKRLDKKIESIYHMRGGRYYE